MSPPKKDRSQARAPESAAAPRGPVLGLEAEFTLLVDGEEQRPEDFFRSPRNLLRHHDGRFVPRSGRSVHLPSGGALYFDTGVIEVATGLIELEAAGGCARAVRSLWEQIAFVRARLDEWETRRGVNLRLRGFSAHYNFSLPHLQPRHAHALANALCRVLPAPTILLAANRFSTAIGARPRPGRIEITADFTPDPALMNACAPLLAGIVTAMGRWPDDQLTGAALIERGLPLFAGLEPSKHSSRKGWRAHAGDFPRNPFTSDANRRDWLLADGRRASLRQIACETLGAFAPAVRRFAGRATFTHLREVLEGKARSLLDLDEGPPAYQDVGRSVDWGRRTGRPLPRSAYERVMQRVISHQPLQIGRSRYVIDRMPGWYEFVFRNVRTGTRRTFNLDELARRL